MNRQTVLITGASGNLGRSVASEFRSRGARLVLLDKQHGDADGSSSGEDQLRLDVDLLDDGAVKDAVARSIARFGTLDVVCNLAGGFEMSGPVHETADEAVRELFDLNVMTLLHVTRAAVPHLIERGGGKIVNVGAQTALKGVARMGAYCVGKSAVIRLTESLSSELRAKNINVNCVLPSVLDTPQNRSTMPQANPAKWVAPSDLASVIAFLASDAARAVHGAAIPVTGLS